jgi:hypothetical protein
MWGAASGEHCLVIDSSSEEIMFVYSTDAVRAEMQYRQDRIRRDFQRPFWFQRKRVPQPPQPCAPELRARPAM